MKEIGIKEYENLRERGARLVGRVIPYDSSLPVIYFTVDPDQQNFGSTAILDTLLLTHKELCGQFDVIRHWATPEIVTVKYKEQ
ncbi:hypothetical protein [uncultured Muribaculum sp.]|jgi:hypothetical protein|uniref:hypothetical protein n=1 Tax=uncultured Muribaculum sp. TaxID=1918613 RepID=UPI0025B00D50|nr:hypothetical protein [uncultured Muribaculum sp.]